MQLTSITDLPAPISTAVFAAGSRPAQHHFEGVLLVGPGTGTSHIEVLKDEFNITSRPELRVSQLPDFRISLIHYGNVLIPVRRGPQRTQHPYWEYIVEPGAAWQEASDGDWSRASLPFALIEKNQNCLHNGLMTFLFKSDGTVSNVVYQVGSETCRYLHINLWGVAKAEIIRQRPDNYDETIADWREETSNRTEVRTLQELEKRYPGFDTTMLLPPASDDISVYGLVADGVHYRSTCPTRFGPYPYCDVINLPSYSLAKSIFAGLGYMMMVRQWPEFEHVSISSLIPECELPDGRWDDVTPWHLVNMLTGNYTSAGYSIDEDSEEMFAFFLAESHADKIRFSCEAWARQQPPGTQPVYHTTDDYLLGTAMAVFLRQKEGRQADIFRDIIVKKIFEPIHLSQGSRVSQRTYDQANQPFTAYGLFFRPDDIARLGDFLHQASEHTELFRQQDITAALFKNGATPMRWPDARNEAYSLGFWGFDVAPFVPCSSETWIPFMSGYGGIILALLPNGVTYYYFTDGGHGSWKNAVIETKIISYLCDIQ